MQYGKILSRAWEITWRWKVLWILGFLAALGRGGTGSSGSSYSTSGEGNQWGSTFAADIPGEIWAVIAGVACLAVLIGIALWVVSVIARGGLIAGVQQVEDEGATTFGQAWRAGASRFWTLFGISVLTALPFLVLLVLAILVIGLFVAGAVGFADTEEMLAAGIVLPSVICGGLFCCGAIILGVVLNQIRVYAERAAVLEGLGWIDAFKRGWDVIKENFGPTAVLWLIFLAIGFVLAVIIGAVMVVVFIPVIAVVANTDPGVWMAAPLCCGGLLAMVVGALISAIVETFTSATWTLAYREFTGLAVPPAQELELA